MKRTARHYKKNPKSRYNKDAYNKEYNKNPSAVKKRVEANRARRKAKAAGKNVSGKDFDHATGRFVKSCMNYSVVHILKLNERLIKRHKECRRGCS